MRILIIAVILVFPTILFSQVLSGRVVKIADGDTFTLLINNHDQVKVRLEGIDAPEKKQAYGNKAKQYLSSMIWGVPVMVKVLKKDRYGRSIGKVSTSKIKDVNLEMIKAGFAWHYKEYNKDKTYAAAEGRARKNKVGIWRDRYPISPQEFRRMKRKNCRRF